MILFGLFVLICMCIIHPSLLIVYLSPVVIFFIYMGYNFIKWKLKYGVWLPTAKDIVEYEERNGNI